MRTPCALYINMINSCVGLLDFVRLRVICSDCGLLIYETVEFSS